MNNNKFLGLIGLCRKAGKIKTGFNKAEESVKSGKAKAVFIAADLSQKTEKEVRFAARNTEVPIYRTEFALDELSAAIGIPAGVITVEDEGFATALISHLQGGKTV